MTFLKLFFAIEMKDLGQHLTVSSDDFDYF